MNDNYIFTNVFIPKCSKCKCEINKFNISLTHWCDCDGTENIGNKIIARKNIHINEIYKQLNFEKQKLKVHLNHHEKIKKNISHFISKTKKLVKGIIHCYFKSKLNLFNLFNLSDKNYLDCDNEGILFFYDEGNEKLFNTINNLNTSKLSPKDLNDLKNFLLDVHCFILILKNNPYISSQISFQNISFYDQNIKDDVRMDYNYQFQQNLKSFFYKTENNCNYFFCKKLVQVFPIIEKNLFLLIYIDHIEMYNFEEKKIVLIIKSGIKDSKIRKINSENLIILKNNILYFVKIKYNLENNPIDFYYFDSIELENNIEDFDIINEKNIVCVDDRYDAHLFNVSYCNDKISYNISKSENIFVYHDKKRYMYYYINNKIIVDKINNQIVFFQQEISGKEDIFFDYFWDDYIFIKIYDVNLSPKNKVFQLSVNFFNYHEEGSHDECKILNSNLYIIFFRNKIYLISAKYLEIVSIYTLSKPLQYCKKIILEKSKHIILYNKRYEVIYKLFQNEIIEEKIWTPHVYKRTFFDIIEINEKGDFIIVKLIRKNMKNFRKISEESYKMNNNIFFSYSSYKGRDNYLKKMKKKLKLKKDRNKLRKKLKKHYISYGRKIKNDYKKESKGNKRLKKYIEKYAIKGEKIYKKKFDEEINDFL